MAPTDLRSIGPIASNWARELFGFTDRLTEVRISAPTVGVCLLMVSACAGTATSPSTVDQRTTTTVQAAATTSTGRTSSTTTEAEATTSLQRLDEAGLQPVGSSVTLPGYLAEEHVPLPDGRLLLFTFEEGAVRAIVFDPDVNRVDLVADAPFAGGARPLGYSTELERVVMLGFGIDTQHLYFFDPSNGSFSDKVFGGEDIGWVHEAALVDGGRKVAIYETLGYDETRIGEPPQVRVGDLTTNILGDPIEVTGVVHGHAELAPDAIRNPQWPYGDVEPGIAFDELGSRLFVVHADGTGLTTIDLLAETTEVTSFTEPPSFWTGVMSWLIPPAQAKGNEPSASLSAWLNHDRSQLLVTGEVSDAWRDAENRLHTTHTALGLMVINTENLELERTLELPANRGLSTRSAVVLTGSQGSQIWCDEVCKPGNNEPEVEGESESSGLILLDPTTLEIRQQYRPGHWFSPRGVYEDWLLVETSSDDWWGYETINLVNGQAGGRTAEVFGTSYVIVTDQGIYLAGQDAP